MVVMTPFKNIFSFFPAPDRGGFGLPTLFFQPFVEKNGVVGADVVKRFGEKMFVFADIFAHGLGITINGKPVFGTDETDFFAGKNNWVFCPAHFLKQPGAALGKVPVQFAQQFGAVFVKIGSELFVFSLLGKIAHFLQAFGKHLIVLP